MNKEIGFRHGALADSYEVQANKQGYTLGDSADFVQRVAFGLNAAHIHGCMTDAEYSKIIQRFQKKVIMKRLRELNANEDDWAGSGGNMVGERLHD